MSLASWPKPKRSNDHVMTKRVEMLFAHLKRILRLGRLRLRGPCGAQFEFTLAAIAQNLRRLASSSPGPHRRPPHVRRERRVVAALRSPRSRFKALASNGASGS